ncbi:MAG: alpha/beta hydrolase fold protein [Marmoricola sp.]|nr:alpha/beta hydrolase fold protein [Marmoricola sp.]
MTSSRSDAVTVSHPTIARWRTRALEVLGDGPVFLLLHGFGDHAGTWLPVLAELEAAGGRAVALDLPGYGEAAPAGSGAALPQLDEFVTAAVEHWTVDGVAPIVVGNSLGGVLAIRAGQDPNTAVAGVVPVSPAGYGHAWFVDLLERFHQLNPLLFVPVVPMNTFRTMVATGFAWAAAGGGSRVLPGIARAAGDQFRTRADVKRILGTAPDLLQEIRAVAPAAVTVPCLIIWGRHDRLTLVSGAAVLKAMVPSAELLVLDDCGHCSQVTRPDLVATHLVGFARSLTSSPV